MTHEETIALIHKIQTGDVADRLIAMLRPSARLVPGKVGKKTGKGRSFLGGVPLLEKGTDWPRWDTRGEEQNYIASLEDLMVKNPGFPGFQQALEKARAQTPEAARPLAFLGQVFLDEIASAAPIDGLPVGGSLAFFFDTLGCPGGYAPEHKGSCRVIYSPEGAVLEAMKAPADLGKQERHGRRGVTIKSLWLPPYILWGSKDEELDDLLENVIDYLGNDAGFFTDEGSHRLGGYPYHSLNDHMELNCELGSRGLDAEKVKPSKAKAKEYREAARDWVMLLQLTADSAWRFGDPGTIMFWIRKHDLERGVFDDVWAIFDPS
jgi:uncharacterized protein YwqG